MLTGLFFGALSALFLFDVGADVRRSPRALITFTTEMVGVEAVIAALDRGADPACHAILTEHHDQLFEWFRNRKSTVTVDHDYLEVCI